MVAAKPKVVWLLGADSGALKREDLPADCFVIYQVEFLKQILTTSTFFVESSPEIVDMSLYRAIMVTRGLQWLTVSCLAQLTLRNRFGYKSKSASDSPCMLVLAVYIVQLTPL